MYSDCHAILGWSIGVVGGGDSRARRYSTVAAVLPDVDAIPSLFNSGRYAELHHTFGHNVFVWLLVSAFVYLHLRSWRAGILIFLSFGSHLLTDAYLSGMNLYLFWPFSHQGFLSSHAVDLGHPLNTQLFYVGLVVIVILAVIYKVTPVDLFSPALDRLLVSLFSPRCFECHLCGRKTNQQCLNCHTPVCFKHSVIHRCFFILCKECAGRHGN